MQVQAVPRKPAAILPPKSQQGRAWVGLAGVGGLGGVKGGSLGGSLGGFGGFCGGVDTVKEVGGALGLGCQVWVVDLRFRTWVVQGCPEDGLLPGALKPL